MGIGMKKHGLLFLLNVFLPSLSLAAAVSGVYFLFKRPDVSAARMVAVCGGSGILFILASFLLVGSGAKHFAAGFSALQTD